MSGNKFENEKRLRVPSALFYNNEFATYRHPLTINESRIFTLVCMQMEKYDKAGDYYRIPWKGFVALSPRMNSRRKILAFLNGLMDKRVISDNEKETTLFPYITKARFVVGEYVDIVVDADMVDLVLKWKKDNYSTAHFECLFNFKNEHAWRLYFVLAQRAYKGSPPLDISVERLKFYLNIDANSPTYKNFGNIRNKILNVVQKAFKKTSNFQFTFITLPEGGRGKRIEFVRFTVGEATPRQTTVTERINKILLEAKEARRKKEKEKPAPALLSYEEIKELDLENENTIYTFQRGDGKQVDCWFNGPDFVFADHKMPAISKADARAKIKAGEVAKKQGGE